MPQLQQDAQAAVRNGVKKDSLADARDYIDNFLRYKTLRDCAQTTVPGAPTPQPLPTSQQPGRDCATTTVPGGGG